MIEQNQRFMPVLRDGNIIGAITRTDLLRVLYEEFLRKRHLDKEDTVERSSPGRNLSHWLKEKFPRKVYEILLISGEIADTLGFNAYLVGGSVRDLLLGEENLDIDIVIEGDGIRFARELSERLKTKVKYHERFGTAHIVLDGLGFDIATARTEYYESPAALPKVETSSIKKDLYRRDFTINTLAVKLNPRDFGLLIDFFGGQRDIREKTIRVLHNLSYVEDPTRAFRAVRFSERFGFKLSRHTENLIKSALQMNLFERLSGHRLYEELMLAFNETNPIRTLRRLSDYGLLKVIHRDLVFDEAMETALSSMYETLAWYNLLYFEEQVDTGVLYLMTLLFNLGDASRQEALERLGAPPRTHDIIMKSIPASAGILKRLPLRDPVGIYHLLKEVNLEILLFSMAGAADAKKKKEISLFLVELRKVRPLLKGRDLKKLGISEGPLYSKILSDLRDERLRGTLRTEEDEKRYVLDRYLAGARNARPK
jgi:tRNA nucleotidyltransferase (CCA-adding enzyme)